jgi:hypothetical protein
LRIGKLIAATPGQLERAKEDHFLVLLEHVAEKRLIQV